MTTMPMCAKPAKPQVGRRLRPLRLAMFLQGVAPWVPVEKIFMSEIGFNPALVATMAAAYAAVVPVMEIPSGILADRWSRRGVLMLAAGAALLSVIVGGLSQNVGTYIVSAMILGVYFAMQSGTVEAAVYDTLLEDAGGSDDFEKHLGRVQLLNSVALVGSAIAGGLIAALADARMTYFLTIPCALLAIVALTRFREPTLHQQHEPFTKHIATTFKAITGRAGLSRVVLAMALGSMTLQMLFEFGPLWLIAAGASTVLFGPYTAGMTAAFGIGGSLAGRLRLDRPARAIGMLTAMVTCSLILVATNSVLLLVVAQIGIAVLLVVTGIYLNRVLHDRIPSAIRTSVGSGVSTLSWLMFLPGALLFGLISDHFGVHATAWVITGLLTLTGIALVRVSR
jgi:MFS family permease